MSLAGNLDTMEAVLPMDASTEELDLDDELSFLDDFVEAAIDFGATSTRTFVMLACCVWCLFTATLEANSV